MKFSNRATALILLAVALALANAASAHALLVSGFPGDALDRSADQNCTEIAPRNL